MENQVQLKIVIPEDLNFADLELGYSEDGSVHFRWDVIERICAASGIPIETFKNSHEDNVAGLLVSWYAEHRQKGGASDPVAEDLISEVAAEIRVGQGAGVKPGRA